MKNYFTTVFLAFLLCQNSYAQRQLAASQPPAGLDSMLVELKNAIAESHMPGLLISIVNKSGVVYSGGIGYSNLALKQKVTGQTAFRFASVTKMFTALAIEKLVSEGKFKLTDPIKKIAPEISFDNMWEKSHPVQVIHLLEHTAGFEDVQLGRMIAKDGKSIHGISAVKFHESSLKSRWRPGERMSYSNPGYEVLGYLIEKFSGMSVDKYIQKNIFLPLGMSNSAILMDDAVPKNLANAYHFNGSIYDIVPKYTLASNGATGNLVSCADDVSKFLVSLLNCYQSNSVRIIPEENAMEMDSIHSSLAARGGLQAGYALGNTVFANNKKVTFRGHEGLGEGFSSWIFYNRENGLAYAIANNSGANNWRISQIIESFITKNFPPIVAKAEVSTPDSYKEFEGYYAFANPKNDRWDFLQKVFNGVTVSFSKHKIVMKNSRGNVDTLEYVHGNLFKVQSEIIPTFILSKDENGVPFVQGYNTSLFFTKVTKAPIIVQKFLLYAGFISILVTLVFGGVALALLVLKKIKFQVFALSALPALASLSGLLAYRTLSVTDELNKIAFATINATTLFIFFASLGFGLFAVISLVQLIMHWNILKSTLIKMTLLCSIVLLCYLTGIFFINGWIGVRIWPI